MSEQSLGGGIEAILKHARRPSLARIALWNNIPEEMRKLPRWGIATLELVDSAKGKVDKAPRHYRTHALLSPASDEGWSTFDEVIASNPPAIGFRISEDDPFVVIDLDRKRADTQERKTFFDGTLKLFSESPQFPGTYIERSVSSDPDRPETASYHIVLKGEAGDNRQRGAVEVYRRNHFIIMTGDMFLNRPVATDNGILSRYLAKMPPSQIEVNRDMPIQTGPMLESDEVVLQRMFGAGGQAAAAPALSRGERARELYMTDHQALPESTDISSLEMELAHAIVAQTQNPEQFYRVFSQSRLYRGQSGGKSGYVSQAAYDDKYLMGYTFTTAMRAWQERKARESAYEDAVAKVIEQARANYDQAESDPRFFRGDAKMRPLPPIDVPPGLIGEMAKYIFETSPRPLWESAIAGALALFAAYTGRHYNINGTGLTLYILMVGSTGKGKETGPRGAMQLFEMVKEKLPVAEHFLLGSSLTSGSAAHNGLSRVIDDESNLALPSKLLIWGEAAKTLYAFAKPEPSEHVVTLRRFMLDAYSKSAWNSTIAPQVYARQDAVLPAIKAPNLVLLGDMTEEGMSTILTPHNIADGFVPRLTFIEYRGKRPSLQMDRDAVSPPVDLVNRLAAVVSAVLRKNVDGICTRIGFTKEAREAYQAFEAEVDEKIDLMEAAGSTAAGEREIWTRSGVKVLRIAGLVAVGCNHIAPEVELDHMKWAIALVRRDIQSMGDHMSRGSSLLSHEDRMCLVMEIVREYFSVKPEERAELGAPMWQIEAHVIGRGYITSQVVKNQAFLENMERDQRSPNTIDSVLDITLRGLVARGFLIEERYDRYEASHQLATETSRGAEPLYRLNSSDAADYKRASERKRIENLKAAKNT